VNREAERDVAVPEVVSVPEWIHVCPGYAGLMTLVQFSDDLSSALTPNTGEGLIMTHKLTGTEA
jgi:hypothetical protein